MHKKTWQHSYLSVIEEILNTTPYLFNGKAYRFDDLVARNILQNIASLFLDTREKGIGIHNNFIKFKKNTDVNGHQALKNIHTIFIERNESVGHTFDLDTFKAKCSTSNLSPIEVFNLIKTPKNEQLLPLTEKSFLQLSILEKIENPTTIIPLNQNYWEKLDYQASEKKQDILERYYLNAESQYAHHVIVLNEKNNSIETHSFNTKKILIKTTSPNIFDEKYYSESDNKELFNFNQYIENKFAKSKVREYIEVKGPSGCGKTHILAEAAHFFSLKEYYEIFQIDKFEEGQSLNELEKTIIGSEKRMIFFLDKIADKELFYKKCSLILDKKEIWSKNILFIIISDQDSEKKDLNTISHWEQVLLSISEENYEEVKMELFNFIYPFYISETEVIQQLKNLWDDNLLKKYTIRELIYTTLQLSGFSSNFKTLFDWHTFEAIAENPKFKDYKNLYSFVALFSYFGVRVPLKTFRHGYLKNLDDLAIQTFVNKGYSNHTLKIVKNIEKDRYEIDLRHNDLAKWYFSISANQEAGILTLDNFLSDVMTNINSNDVQFQKDEMGGYLLRNIYRYLLPKSINNRKENDLNKFQGKLSQERALNMFENYQNYLSYQFNLDEKCKIIYEIVKLEPDFSKKIKWLDELIDNTNDTENNYREIHQKVSELTKQLRKTKDKQLYIYIVDLILNNINKWPQSTSPFLNSLFDIDNIQGNYIRDYISYAKDDFDSLLKLAKYILRKYNNREKIDNVFILKVINILKYIKDHMPASPLSYMVLADLYLSQKNYDLAEIELQKIIKINNSDIHARIRLAESYRDNNKAEKAENILINSIDLFSNQPAFHVLLVKLYRTKVHFFININEKINEAFNKAFKNIKGYSQEIWTEKAKWLIEDLNTEESHKLAKKILITNIRLNPLYAHSITELGMLYQKSDYIKNLDKSILELKKAVILTQEDRSLASYEAPRIVLCKSYILRRSEDDWKEARKLSKEVYNRYSNDNIKNGDLIEILKKVYLQFEEFEELKILEERISNYKKAILAKFEIAKSNYRSKKDVNEIKQFLISVDHELMFDSILCSKIGNSIGQLEKENPKLLELSLKYLKMSYNLNKYNEINMDNLLIVLGKLLKIFSDNPVIKKGLLLENIYFLINAFLINQNNIRFLVHLKNYYFHSAKCYRKALRVIEKIILTEGFEGEKWHSKGTAFLIYQHLGNFKESKENNINKWKILNQKIFLIDQDLKGFINSDKTEIKYNDTLSGKTENYRILNNFDKIHPFRVVSDLVEGGSVVYFAKIQYKDEIFANVVEPSFNQDTCLNKDEILRDLAENKKRFETPL